jgi:hypothetical protein
MTRGQNVLTPGYANHWNVSIKLSWVQERVGSLPKNCLPIRLPKSNLLLSLAHFFWTVENFCQHLVRSGPTGFVCTAGEPRLYHTPVEDGMGCNFIIRGE